MLLWNAALAHQISLRHDFDKVKTLLPIILAALLCGCAATAPVKPVVVMPPMPPAPSLGYETNMAEDELSMVTSESDLVYRGPYPPPVAVICTGVFTMSPYAPTAQGTYFAQSSADLKSWILVATNGSNIALTVTDNVPSPLKFYRTGFGSLTAQ